MTDTDQTKSPHLYERIEATTSHTSSKIMRILWRIIFWSGLLIGSSAGLIAIISSQFFWAFWSAVIIWSIIALPCLVIILILWFYSSQITEIKENIDMVRTLDAESFAKDKTQELLLIFLIFLAILIGLTGYTYFSFPNHTWILWVGGIIIALISLIFGGLYLLLRSQIKRLPALQEKVKTFTQKYRPRDQDNFE